MSKLKSYAKENNPFNILEHAGVVDPFTYISFQQLKGTNNLEARYV